MCSGLALVSSAMLYPLMLWLCNPGHPEESSFNIVAEVTRVSEYSIITRVSGAYLPITLRYS